MELYFLGTGAGLPQKERNVTSIALRLHQERNAFWLIDCGEGTQHQMLSSPLRMTKLEKVFITHLHGDHIFGLPGLLGSRAFQSGKTPLTLYGPVGLKQFIETTLQVSQSHLPYALDVVEIDEGLVCEDDQFTVTCRRLSHGVPSYGYRFEEQPAAGHLKREQLLEAGVPEGPVYGQLKAGKNVQLPDGRTLYSHDYVSPPAPGRTVVVLGDTTPCAAIVDLARDANLLVHEATYRQVDADRAAMHNHSTTLDAATAAAAAGVKQLILTHISARYDEKAVKGLLKEAKRVFPNTHVAKDHLSFEISRNG